MKPAPGVVLPIAPRIIAINDTMYYDIADITKIEGIYSVYLYDKNTQTFCCEITPSYSLIGLYTSVKFAGNVDDDYREKMYEKYCDNGAPEDTYLHRSGLDDIEKKGEWKKNGDLYIADDVTIEEDDTYDETMESLREYYCGNCVV